MGVPAESLASQWSSRNEQPLPSPQLKGSAKENYRCFALHWLYPENKRTIIFADKYEIMCQPDLKSLKMRMRKNEPWHTCTDAARGEIQDGLNGNAYYRLFCPVSVKKYCEGVQPNLLVHRIYAKENQFPPCTDENCPTNGEGWWPYPQTGGATPKVEGTEDVECNVNT